MGSIPGSGRSPRKGNGNPTPVFLPGESHGQRSLADYSPWGRKELDTTEWPTHTQKAYILYIHTHKHTMEYYYSAIKKNEIMPYAPNGWIGDYDTKSDGERQIPWYCLYTESKKVIQMNLFTKQKQTHRLREQIYSYWRKGGGRDRLGVWDWHIHTAIFKITSKDPLYHTGNSSQYYAIA